MESRDGNAYKRISICKIPLLPGNLFLEKMYAAGMPVHNEIATVTTASTRLFLNHISTGSSTNTFR